MKAERINGVKDQWKDQWEGSMGSDSIDLTVLTGIKKKINGVIMLL